VTAPLDALRVALENRDAWLVGGAVRDRLLGRDTDDIDLAVAGDAREAAQTLRRATGAAAFSLSDAFGGWRVVGRDQAWQVDVQPLVGGTLERDLAARDFTVNAMAEPLGGGDLVDPHGGVADLRARRLRMVSANALVADPLRTLRAVRLAAELGFTIDPETLEAVRRHAPGLTAVAAERVFAELKRIVGAADPAPAVRLLEQAGAAGIVLPELVALRGVGQNVFHHLDVHDHTLEVLDAVARLQREPALLGPRGEEAALHLARPVGDGLDGWQLLRWAALLHDAAKPATRAELGDGRVSFVGHDSLGAEMARDVMRRLRSSERVAEQVAALTRNHLVLGFLVHERPLPRRTVHRYLTATEPYAIDVTVFTVADRLATRGRNAEPAITAHLELAAEMLGYALDRRATIVGVPLVRGDELAHELGRAPGPWLTEVLAQIEEDRYAGEVTTREQALARARELTSGPPRGTP
jgi:poly(A) polymerase